MIVNTKTKSKISNGKHSNQYQKKTDHNNQNNNNSGNMIKTGKNLMKNSNNGGQQENLLLKKGGNSINGGKENTTMKGNGNMANNNNNNSSNISSIKRRSTTFKQKEKDFSTPTPSSSSSSTGPGRGTGTGTGIVSTMPTNGSKTIDRVDDRHNIKNNDLFASTSSSGSGGGGGNNRKNQSSKNRSNNGSNNSTTTTAINGQKCPSCKHREFLEKFFGVSFKRTFINGEQKSMNKSQKTNIGELLSSMIIGKSTKTCDSIGRKCSSLSSTSTGGGGGSIVSSKFSSSSLSSSWSKREHRFPLSCIPITAPTKPVLSGSLIDGVCINSNTLTLYEKSGTGGQHNYPVMQCGTLEVPDSYQRPSRMDAFHIYDDGFHSDDETDTTPPPSPSSASSIASTSDHGSLECVDAGGAQRLAVLSFEQVRKLNDVMNETVSIHGSGNFPTLEVTLKDLVTLVRKKLETDVQNGGAGMVVKDIRLNGGAASHVLASEAQPYNDVDFIFAVEFSTSRHYDRVKNAVLNVLCDLLPEGVSRRRITPCALKDAYVGKMVKVNLNSDGDKWSLISLGNSPGHKNVELKFVDTMRRQFEFSVDSFQIVLDSLLLFYDCAALPISENFYPTVVGESVYGDFQEALYHLQKKLISTRQPEEIRGGGLLKYCNLLVRNYKPVDPERIKTLERYMCSRFFIDFPDITTQEVKLDAYLRNHFWGLDEEPLQYQYLMHLREVVEASTVCLMGHERRQTLLLIQSLAMEVLCRGQQKQQQQQQAAAVVAAAVAQQQHHQQQQQQQHQQHQQQSQHLTQQQQQQQQQQSQSIAQQPNQSQQQQQQSQQQSTAVAAAAQQIHIQTPPGYIYANGVYYAPVIPTTTICTCNSTWLST